jgi:hypothetical protein
MIRWLKRKGRQGSGSNGNSSATNYISLPAARSATNAFWEFLLSLPSHMNTISFQVSTFASLATVTSGQGVTQHPVHRSLLSVEG